MAEGYLTPFSSMVYDDHTDLCVKWAKTGEEWPGMRFVSH